MSDIVFITGNQHKADYAARYLGEGLEHMKIDLDEIQSLDLKEIVSHKVRQAYEKAKRPVIVEDVSLEFTALGRLPGPFIRWFQDELGVEKICRLLDGKDRDATARCVIGYFDGTEERQFEGMAPGSIAEKPAEGAGYGFDSIFIHDGFSVPRSQMGLEDHDRTYFELKRFDLLKEYLETKKSRA